MKFNYFIKLFLVSILSLSFPFCERLNMEPTINQNQNPSNQIHSKNPFSNDKINIDHLFTSSDKAYKHINFIVNLLFSNIQVENIKYNIENLEINFIKPKNYDALATTTYINSNPIVKEKLIPFIKDIIRYSLYDNNKTIVHKFHFHPTEQEKLIQYLDPKSNLDKNIFLYDNNIDVQLNLENGMIKIVFKKTYYQNWLNYPLNLQQVVFDNQNSNHIQLDLSDIKIPIHEVINLDTLVEINKNSKFQTVSPFLSNGNFIYLLMHKNFIPLEAYSHFPKINFTSIQDINYKLEGNKIVFDIRRIGQEYQQDQQAVPVVEKPYEATEEEISHYLSYWVTPSKKYFYEELLGVITINFLVPDYDNRRGIVYFPPHRMFQDPNILELIKKNPALTKKIIPHDHTTFGHLLHHILKREEYAYPLDFSDLKMKFEGHYNKRHFDPSYMDRFEFKSFSDRAELHMIKDVDSNVMDFLTTEIKDMSTTYKLESVSSESAKLIVPLTHKGKPLPIKSIIEHIKNPKNKFDTVNIVNRVYIATNGALIWLLLTNNVYQAQDDIKNVFKTLKTNDFTILYPSITLDSSSKDQLVFHLTRSNPKITDKLDQVIVSSSSDSLLKPELMWMRGLLNLKFSIGETFSFSFKNPAVYLPYKLPWDKWTYGNFIAYVKNMRNSTYDLDLDKMKKLFVEFKKILIYLYGNTDPVVNEIAYDDVLLNDISENHNDVDSITLRVHMERARAWDIYANTGFIDSNTPNIRFNLADFAYDANNNIDTSKFDELFYKISYLQDKNYVSEEDFLDHVNLNDITLLDLSNIIVKLDDYRYDATFSNKLAQKLTVLRGYPVKPTNLDCYKAIFEKDKVIGEAYRDSFLKSTLYKVKMQLKH